MNKIDKEINIRIDNYITGIPLIYSMGIVYMWRNGKATWWTRLINIMPTIEQ